MIENRCLNLLLSELGLFGEEFPQHFESLEKFPFFAEHQSLRIYLPFSETLEKKLLALASTPEYKFRNHLPMWKWKPHSFDRGFWKADI